MTSLPTPGGDEGTWGVILNGFLTVSHNADGTLQPTALTAAGAVTGDTGITVSGTPSNGQVLTATGGSTAVWTMPSGGGGSGTLAADSDVRITSPSANQVLAYNGTASTWQNATLTESDVTGLTSDLASRVQVGGDLAGTPTAPTVTKINGITISGTPSTAQVLTATSGTAATWQTVNTGSGSSTLAGDSDVTITGASNNQVLTYSSAAGKWVNQVAPTAPVTSVDGMTGAVTGLLQTTNNLSELSGSASTARTNLSAAKSGVNSDLTSLSGLTTPLSLAQGGTGNTTGNAATATNLAGGATLPDYLAPAVVTLSAVSSAVAVNAALGNAFNLSITATGWTISNPTNPADGQVIRFRLTAGGNYITGWGTAYDFGTGSAPVLSTTSGKIDICAFEYLASISKWAFLGAGLGY